MTLKHWGAVIVMVIGVLACNATAAVQPEPTPPEPTAEQPATEQPTTEQPTVEQPTTAPPTNEPTEGPTAAPATEQPTAAPTNEPDLSGPDYGVVMVEEGDVLNVRSGPGVQHEVVATFLPIFAAIKITGPGEIVADGGLWVPVQRLEVSGWVNRYFLTQVVPSDEACSDPEAEAIIDSVIAAVEAQDGDALAALVEPERGLHIRLNWWNEEVRLAPDEVSLMFEGQVDRYWGMEMGTGDDINGTAAEVVVPVLEDDLLAAERQRACNEILAGGTAGLVQVPPEYIGFNYYSVHRPPPDQEENIFDWGTWVIGIEYWDDTPHLVYLVHYVWEV